MMNNYNIGSLFKNNTNDEICGVLVNKLNDKLYFFNLADNQIPVFNKIEQAEKLTKIGCINDDCNSKLKNQLLKYYRTHNLENNEMKLLQPLMDFTFYNGVPDYNVKEQPVIEHMDLKKYICDSENGNCIFIHTSSNSPFSFLNQKKCYIVDKNEEGMWINDINNERFHFLFYKNKNIPTFSGISRIEPVENIKLKNEKFQSLYKKLLELNSSSDMIYDGDKVTIDPVTKNIILPFNKYKNTKYSIDEERFVKEDVLEEIENYEPKLEELNEVNEIENLKQCIQGGGGREEETDTISELQQEDDYKKELYKSKKRKILSDMYEMEQKQIITIEEESENKKSKKSKKEEVYELDEVDEIIDFEEDDIEIIEVIEKNVIQEKEEKNKQYNESLEISEINKIFINEYPIALKNTDMIINKVKKRVAAFIEFKNNIVKIVENEKKYNITPFLLNYIFGDYNNDFLIPLVINKKKIYTTKDDIDINNNMSNVVNFYQEVNSLNFLLDFDKKDNENDTIKYNYHIINDKIQSISNPYDFNININNNKEFNIFNIRLGEIKDKILENSNLVQNDNIINMNNIEKFKIKHSTNNLDVLTFRYCSKSFNCETYNLNKVLSDYLVNLGSHYKYSSNVSTSKKLNKLLAYEKINTTIGENINIVGFLRLPISLIYMINNDKIYKNKTINNFDSYVEKLYNNDVEIVNLSKIKKNDFFKNPTDFTMFLFDKHNELDFYDYLNKLLPSFSDIIDYHQTDIKNTYNTDIIYDILKIYGYDKNELNYEQIKILNKHYEIIHNKNKDLLEKINLLEKKLNKTEKIKNTNIITIDDYIIEELEKISSYKYIFFKKDIDNDFLRLNWIIQNKHNLNFYINNINNSYYNSINVSNEKDVLQTQIELKKNEILKLNESNFTSENKNCFKNKKIKFVKYKNRDDLEKTNFKEIYDNDNELIKIDDIAFIEKDKKKQFYRRIILNDLQQWIEEDEDYIKEIIEEKKKNNISFCDPSIYSDLFTFDIDKPGCSLNIDEYECESFKHTINQNIIDNKKNELNILEDQLKNIDIINKDISLNDKNINEAKNNLLNEKKTVSNQIKYSIANKKKEMRLLEDIMKIKKNCVHFNMLNYISKIQNTTLEEKYKYYQLVFNNYLNTNFMIDIYNIKDPDTTQNINKKKTKELLLKNVEDYTICNICNQDLLCKHWYYGVKKLETEGDIDIENLINIYGVEKNGLFLCKICGEVLASSDIQDIFENKQRDNIINVDTEENEKVKLLDKYLKSIETDNEQDNIEVQFKLDIFYHFKEILNIHLRNDDEKEMLVFLKTHNFIKKDLLFSKLKIAKPNLPNKIANTLVLSKYYRYISCDIGARFLIILQTSKKEYLLKNTFCNNNYVGYPVIDDISHTNGIDLILCIFRKLGLRQKYKFLEKDIKSMFIDRLNFFLETNEFIINKILLTRDNNAKKKINEYNFDTYEHKHWDTFKPNIAGYISLINKPERKLFKKDLKNMTSANYNKILTICNENILYYSNIIFYLINKIVKEEILRNKYFKSTTISNSCCLTLLPSNNYLDYFINIDKDIKKYIEDYKELIELKNIISDKTRTYLTKLNITTTFQKKNIYIPLSFNIKENDIVNYFRKYINEGLYTGKEYSFNKYNICILTSKNKENVFKESSNYSIIDYNKLYNKVNLLNKVHHIELEVNKDTDSEHIEINKIYNYKNIKNVLLIYDYIIYQIKDYRKLSIMKDIFEKIKKNIIENKKNYNEWSIIINLMRNDITSILKVIFKSKKDIFEYNKKLNNLNYFDNLYKEKIDINFTKEEASTFKYLKAIDYYKKNFNFLYQSIMLIKTKKIYNIKNIDKLRPQYHYLFEFKNNVILFSRIAEIIEVYKNIFFNLNIQENNYFTLENCCTILHYLLTHCILMILQDDKLGGNKKSSKHNKNKSKKKSKKKMSEIDNEIEKNSNYKSNFYNRIKFVKEYLKKIIELNTNIDSLTINYINTKKSQIEQKQQRRNLKIFQLLKTTDGMEEYRNMILSKLNQGRLQYSQLEDEIEALGFDSSELYKNETVENDNISDKKFYNENSNDDNVLDTNFNDNIVVYGSDDDVEDSEFIL
jgi:hypothetical protein